MVSSLMVVIVAEQSSQSNDNNMVSRMATKLHDRRSPEERVHYHERRLLSPHTSGMCSNSRTASRLPQRDQFDGGDFHRHNSIISMNGLFNNIARRTREGVGRERGNFVPSLWSPPIAHT